MSKILVVNGMSYGKAVEGLGDITGDVQSFMENPDEFSLVMFTGGEDITPSWYGHTSPKGNCHYNEHRDEMEKVIFDHALEAGVRMTGICRGVQFLNVMAGGTMIHHVTSHGGTNHGMATANGDIVRVNSLHHQMVLPPEDAVLIGWSEDRRSDIYIGDGDERIVGPDREAEAVVFPKIGAAGVQYHPEMMSPDSDGYKWYKDLVSCLLSAETMDSVIEQYTGKKKWSTMRAG